MKKIYSKRKTVYNFGLPACLVYRKSKRKLNEDFGLPRLVYRETLINKGNIIKVN